MIESARLTVSADTPEQVTGTLGAALERLGLGSGMGPLAFGAEELVIEGTSSGGYRGRIKLNFGPMNAVASDMWFAGKHPYGSDREEYEQKRVESEVAHAKSRTDLFDAPPPGGDMFPPEFPKFTKAVFVQGKLYAIIADKDCSITEFIAETLRQSNTDHGTAEWELRDGDGVLLIETPPEEAQEPLSLDPRAGTGG